MRILFAGSPEIAVPALEALVTLCGSPRGGGEGFTFAGLLTNPDSPKGRSGKPEPTDCASALERLFLDRLSGESEAPVPVLKPEKLDAAAREQVSALNPDLLVSFAYGKIFGPKFLALFPLGGINIHPSLLPKYRGPTPVQAAIINRETETGITVQKLAAEMDSGDILVQETVPLNGRETAGTLSEIIAEKAAGLLRAALRGIAGGTLQARPQDHGAATYCSLTAKEDGVIDWNLSAAEIDARIRAYDPWPLSRTMHGDRELLILKAEVLEGKALEPHLPSPQSLVPSPHSFGGVLGKDSEKGILIQTGSGILAVSALQYRAKKALEWKAFLNGARDFIGSILG
jgi:methionyl-tRNA formyltransferase